MRGRLPISFYICVVVQENYITVAGIDFRIFQENIHDVIQYIFVSISIVSVQDAYHVPGGTFDAFIHAIINAFVRFTYENVDLVFVQF